MSTAIWQHFAAAFGPANLVPIALAREGIKTELPAGVVGKVPSVYNTRGEIVGFKDWQKCRVTLRNIEQWQCDSRYGFGVILGQPVTNLGGAVAVCVDVDTENTEYQTIVENLIRKAVGTAKVAQRVRTNSQRRAYVLAVLPREGDDEKPITKRVLTLRKGVKAHGIKGEAVEILAHGQQFAAFGVHPSGVELEWLDGPADSLTADVCLPCPALLSMSAGEFDKLLSDIAVALPILADSQKNPRRARGKRGEVVKPDDVALYLDANGYTLEIGADGQRYIRSPFEDEYTTEQTDRDTSVSYFLPGTCGYEQGHFVSLHASDADRTDADFLDAIGFVASQFDAFPVEMEQGKPVAPSFERDKHGKAEPTVPNVLAALGAPRWLGQDVRFDAFAGELVIGGAGAWRSFRDTDYTWLRATLEGLGFKPVGRELIRDAVAAVAEIRTIDTAQEWLNSLKWDGVKRLADFLPRYFRTADNDYTRAVSLYMWTAQAGRVLKPGCKADMMPIFIGDQGCGKSTGVAALSPAVRFFSELSFNDKDADAARKIRGVLVGEYGEMNGLRGRAIEAIKQYVTCTSDKWVAKYQEHATQYDRRCVFYGTSNDTDLLDDSTGNRRWLPIECGAVDVAAIKADCAQLWAEARELFKRKGVQYTTAAQLAPAIHDAFRDVDPFELLLSEWLSTPCELDGTTPADSEALTTTQVLTTIGKEWGLKVDRSGQIRVGKVLKALGFLRFRKFHNGSLIWAYKKQSK
jgi:hypothetical protein